MNKHTPGPWMFRTDAGTGECGINADGTGIFAETYSDIRRAGEFARNEALQNARLIAAAPEMLEALKAEDEADAAFDEAEEYTSRADGEGWLYEPTGSMHVTEIWGRANKLLVKAKELRSAAINKAEGRE